MKRSAKLVNSKDTIQEGNHSTRIPVVLALDTSGSMGANGGYLALNEGVASFFETCKSDSVNKLGFDVCIITFGGSGVETRQDFRTIYDQDDVPVFERPGNGRYGTPLGQAVDTAIRAIEARVKEYKQKHVSHTKRAFLLVITDGQSTEIMPEVFKTRDEFERSRKAFETSAERARQMQRDRKLEVVCVGVGRQDYARLSDFNIEGKVLHTKDFSEFGLLFESLSASASSSVGANDIDGTVPSMLDRMMEWLEDEGVEGVTVEDFAHDDD